ncbi:MAG: hypothetical protein LBC13_03705, partial [Clostridiales bacterium]|nr:hypothetical protein [Clostridiales bacterium]
MSKKRRFLTRFIATALIVGLSGAVIALFAACSKDDKKTKAIIIVPALTASGLYDTSTGLPVWDPLPYDVYYPEVLGGNLNFSKIFQVNVLEEDKTGADIMTLLGDILTDSPSSLLNQVALDQYGRSTGNPNIAPANGYDNKIQYGVLGAYKDEFDALKELYGDDYDVHVFNYDWRMDNRGSSELLEKFVNDNGYKEIILISHSMGGNVVAGYLARSAENRSKVKAYLPYAASFLGSFDALMYLDNPFAAFDYILGAAGGEDAAEMPALLRLLLGGILDNQG